MEYLFLALAIVAEVIGTTALTASQRMTRPFPTLLMIVAYGIAFYLLSLTLEKIPTGIVYAIWSACGIVLISIIGFVMFKQTLDTAALIGMGLIIAGVLVINLFSGSVSH
ncbi:Multidrug transporter EmrE [Polystyrenella longa]|uniref:Multidrug transporter EmrE n=1 Tax=Polystyrenella longa TaxID=2528007 RepID=A0A518CL40_9PLAN|nr:SMR family transporter [Polystyrenella longa]QDU79948.1 Multidrug transporter EmrE [Polystyrenella longa]